MRPVRQAVCTTSGGTIRTLTMKHIKGKGMGSVLLDRGGTGNGSSYSSLDDYISTTGENPMSSTIVKSLGGRGLGSMNKKIESLLVKSNKGKKEKNINFNM